MVSMDQILWYFDTFGYLIFKKFFIGVAKYMTWPQTSLARKVTATHHLWTIPILSRLLVNQTDFPKENILFGIFMSIFTNGIARVFVPHSLKEKNGEEFYLNVNLVYGLWKDVKI